MEKVLIAIGGAVAFCASILFLTPLGAACGALSGWIVSWFFGDTILAVLGKLGLHDVELWQVGATCGFLGGFLRTKVEANVKNED